MLNWLAKHKFQAHLAAFLLMILSSVGMVFLLWADNNSYTWLMVVIFAVSNALAIFIK